MTPHQKTFLLWGSLLLTLWLVWKTEPDEAVVTIPTHRAKQMTSSAQPVTNQSVLNIVQRETMPSMATLFESAALEAQAKTLKKSNVKPPPPAAPPLPFQYLGRWKEDGKLTVMLLADDEVLTAKQGDALLNNYQLTELSETTAGLHIGFLFHPLKQLQYLEVGKAKDE